MPPPKPRWSVAYRLGDLPEPTHFLWCAPPLEAMWAALVLIGRQDGYNVPLLDNLQRLKDGAQKLAAARASVAAKLAIDPDQVEGHFRKPSAHGAKRAPSRCA